MKKLLCVLLAMLLVFSVTACAGNSTEPPATETPATETPATDDAPEAGAEAARTDFVYGLTSDIATLDPSKATDQMSNIIWRQLYDTLVYRTSDGEYEPRLAESWECSEDGLVWTFKIREGVVCHDGTPLTASDCAWSLNRMCAAPTTGGVMVAMTDGGNIAVDDYTLEVHLTFPYGALLNVMAGWGRIASETTTDFENAPIGTGPYKFVSRASGDNVKLAAFDQYYRGEAAIKDLTFKVITDATAQIAAVQKGEIDFLTHAPLSAKQTVLDDSNLSWEETDIRGTIFLVMNHNVAPFDNELVRKAVQCGVSKENMIIGGAEGMGTPLNTMFPTSITGSPEADYTAPYTYDLEKAKSYMKEAGYDENNKPEVTILTCETAIYCNAANTLQGELTRLGFDVTVNQIDRTVFFTECFAGNYQIAAMHTTMPNPDCDFIYPLCHSSLIGMTNYIPVNDPDMDHWAEVGRTSSDPEERVQAYAEMYKLIDENVYWVPLYTFKCAVIRNADLKGFAVDDLYNYYVFDWSW